MKISLNWLKNYIALEYKPEKLGEILTEIGLEVIGIENRNTGPGSLKGVIVGEVKTCGKHPNADRLSVTQVDVGGPSWLHIVCGAPNVRVGQKVLVAMVNSVLYGAAGSAFNIKKTKIRGEVSEGMICAQDELGLGQDHSGIMVLPDEVPVGTKASDYLQVNDDYVFEIDLTPNRSDANCHLGVAEDLCAGLRINHGYSGRIIYPDVSAFKTKSHDLPIKVTVEDSNACPRYCGVSIKGIRIAESPQWLKERLIAVGVRPINNVVDITNFILNEFGQPLHAFDLDKIKGSAIIVKSLPEGTSFVSLEGVERKLSDQDLMICDGEQDGMCIAGVFGGIGTGVTEHSTNLFLESAHFNPRRVRRSSHLHQLFTDAARIFEKGSDPNICDYALKRAALLIKELAGGEIASELVDIYPNRIEPKIVKIRREMLNRVVGIDIPSDQVRAILEALEIQIDRESSKEWIVRIPTNKPDVTREADVIEEILRIFGFNRVPLPGKIKTGVTLSVKPDSMAAKNRVSNFLASAGFFEMMAMSIVHSRYSDLLRIPEDQIVRITNTSNVHMDVMRPDMLLSVLETVTHNQNRQQTDIKLFEFGKSYIRSDNGYEETDYLTISMSGNRKPESWLYDERKSPVTFYTLKSIVHAILSLLGIDDFTIERGMRRPFSYGMKYQAGDEELVSYGKIKEEITSAAGFKQDLFYACFIWNRIMRSIKQDQVQVKEISRFPRVRRDLALVVGDETGFGEIEDLIRRNFQTGISEINLFDVYKDEFLFRQGKRSVAISLIFEDSEKTLSDNEVDQMVGKLLSILKKELGITPR